MQQPIRAVRFPLKLKFTLMLAGMLALTLLTFLLLATKLIREDKAAYVYDAILLRTEEQAATLEARLAQWELLLRAPRPEELRSSPEILFVRVRGQETYQRHPEFAEEGDGWLSNAPLGWSRVSCREAQCLRYKSGEGLMVVALARLTEQDSPFQVELLSTEGERLSGTDRGIVDQGHWFWKILTQGQSRGVFRSDDATIVAYAKIPRLRAMLTASLSEDRAFAVAGYLVNRSIYFGLLILGVAILVGIFVVRPLTGQLEELAAVTQRIGAGDFSSRVKPRTHDEAGALADSVNLMAQEITRYMEEMKEKARLENELQVAQLVQKAFFPPTELRLPALELHSYAAPASECGGDWWGQVSLQQSTLLIIADATGHGVPAALLTASINASKVAIQAQADLDASFATSTARIMRYLNKTVCASGDQIQMTCFLALWNPSTRLFTYTNASHQPALLLPKSDAPLSKDDVRPLLEANGARLGQSPDSAYTETSMELRPGDRMIFYTDGLTEATNPQGQAWGQRRFLKALLESDSVRPEAIVATMQSFQERTHFDDDVTLIQARFL